MIPEPIYQIVRNVAAIYCPMCSLGHVVYPDGEGNWNHGTDDSGGGMFVPSEPCNSAAAYEVGQRLICHECDGTGVYNSHPTGEENWPDRCGYCDGSGIAPVPTEGDTGKMAAKEAGNHE